MDPTAGILSADQTEARSSEKRPAEDGELTVQSPKKARREGVLARDMKKVAEIVLVLDTLGKMRKERSPMDAEREMMAEARGKLVELCQGFAPKDVFPREVFGGIIDDLGLSKLRDERLGFRPPKMSIAEKLLLSKRKVMIILPFEFIFWFFIHFRYDMDSAISAIHMLVLLIYSLMTLEPMRSCVY